MKENQKSLEEIKSEIVTLGQELENIVSVESIAIRLILKNILEIANQINEPTFGENVEKSFKIFIGTMKATANGNSAFFEVFTELASKKFDGLLSITFRRDSFDYDSKKALQIELVFENDQL